MQFSKVPNILTTWKITNNDSEPILKPGDKAIYAIIRMPMNKETRSCYPSIRTIKSYAHCGQKAIESAIERLQKAGVLKLGKTKLKNGKWSNLYEFPETKFDEHFERFTHEFLKMDIPLHLKEYIMDLQEHLFIHKETASGDCSQSNLTLAKTTGWNVSQINKFDTQLMNLEIETQELSDKIDQSGLPIMTKIIDLNAIYQAKLWVDSVNQQLTTTQNHVEEVDDKVDELKKEFENFQKVTDQKINTLQQEHLQDQEKLKQAIQIMKANNLDVSFLENKYLM